VLAFQELQELHEVQGWLVMHEVWGVQEWQVVLAFQELQEWHEVQGWLVMHEVWGMMA